VTTSILQERPITWREAVLPYALAGVNLLAPVMAAHQLGLLPPAVYLTALGLILLGLPASIFFRQLQVNRLTLNILVTIPLVVITWVIIRGDPGLQQDWSGSLVALLSSRIMPAAFTLLHVLVLLSAGRAFVLVSARDLSQSPLPGFTMMLVTVVVGQWRGVTPQIYLHLLLLLATSLYLVSLHFTQGWLTIHPPVRLQRRILEWVIPVCIVLFAVAWWLGMRLQSFNMYSLASRMQSVNNMNIKLPDFLARPGVRLEETIDLRAGGWESGRRLVMTVTVDDRPGASSLLWRGATYGTYTNGRWSMKPSTAVRLYPNSSTGILTLDPREAKWSDPGIRAGIDEGLITAEDDAYFINQTFDLRALAPEADAPVYAAFQPVLIQPQHGAMHDALVRRDGNLAVSLEATRSLTYAVVSLVKPQPRDFRLQQNPQLTPEELAWYLQLPGETHSPSISPTLRTRMAQYRQAQEAGRPFDAAAYWAHSPQSSATQDAHRIWQLASSILQERQRKLNALERVQQLSAYLAREYRYTLKPAPTPKDIDPTVAFLQRKTGFCVHFSGAMVMLCRSAGIPARMVSGFATGERQEVGGAPGKAVYHVLANHAHAWVEVYLPHYGWYTLDPTAGATRLDAPDAASGWSLGAIATRLRTALDTFADRLRHDPLFRLTVGGVVLALLALVLIILYLRRDVPPTLPDRPLTPQEAQRIVASSYQRMHRWLRRWGVMKPVGLTASEFAVALLALTPCMGAHVHDLTSLYIQMTYGGRPATDADARAAIALLHHLREAARHECRHLHNPVVEAVG
jgi:transglutaminase-like putative cysteine protease